MERRPWDLYTPRDRGKFLAVIFLVTMSNYVDKNVIGVLLEPIKNEFHVSDTLLGLLSGISFALFYATLGIPVARWADRGDRKLIITLSLAIWSLMTALCGMATTFWLLVLARFGVGAGEAGAIPPSQSLIADYYPPVRRAWAIGISVVAASAGYILGLVLGGYIAQHYGWRTAFITFGLAGFLIVPLTHFVLKEPRHLPEFRILAEAGESMATALRVLFAKRAYRYVLAGIIIYFLMAYGAFVFLVSAMIRIHGVTVGQAGAIFGGVSAAGAVIGTLAGGSLADRLAARDVAWLPRVAGWGLIVSLPFYEIALVSTSVTVMAAWLFLGAIVLNGCVPAAYSSIHVVCGSRRRALAVALMFFFANLVGLGFGPVIAGTLSDAFAVSRGAAEGLRLSLMIVNGVLLPAGWLLIRAARYFKQDAED